MNKFKTVLSCVLLLLGGEAHSGMHGHNECDNGKPMIEINECASQRYEEADKKLNKVYEAKLKAIKRETNISRFRESQRNWISFRDSACLYEAGKPEETGSVWGLNYYGCMEHFTLNRIKELEDYVACSTDNCPN